MVYDLSNIKNVLEGNIYFLDHKVLNDDVIESRNTNGIMIVMKLITGVGNDENAEYDEDPCCQLFGGKTSLKLVMTGPNCSLIDPKKLCPCAKQ